ncbi:MAG: hypothetical protein J6E42_03620 [Firmicutes bacterium]|nr:hypothetical protein [Bacillota bacterium]
MKEMSENEMSAVLHRTGRRAVAAFLTLTMIAATAGSAFAAAPAVSVDEAMYINADYYGGLEDITVVKGVNMNGLTEFTDYGDYLRVDNMTNRIEPVIEGSSVTWKLDENQKRFYFSAMLEQVQLPWNFDISYFHNGQPADPSKLAGVDGLIEIRVKATPNELASDYYQKNMMLQVLVMADMEQMNSIQAEGAQLQSAGKSTVALFLGLPGEEEEFVVQIGTDSFESAGVIITMIPGTVLQLSEIRELKETMDKAEEAGDALYAGINDMLTAVAGMKPGLTQVKSGVSDLNEARKIADASLDGILDRMDDTISTMRETAKVLSDMDEELDQSNKDMNNLAAQLRSTKRQLSDLRDEMEDVEDDAEDLIEEYMTAYVAEQVENNRTLMNEISAAAAEQVTNQVMALAQQQAVEQAGGMEAFSQLSPQEQQALVGQCAAAIQSDRDTMSRLQDQAVEAAKRSVLTEERLKAEIPYYANVKKLQKSMKNASSELRGMEDEIEDLLTDTGKVMSSTADLVKELKATLDQTAELLESTGDVMEQLQTVVRDSRPYLQSGGENTMVGMIDTLDETMKALDSTKAVKNANSTLKRLIDDEMDSIREENKMLEMDPDAPVQSCTSQENPSPNTLQIIIRTHEISLDAQKDAIVDLETEEEPMTPFQRMVAIFEKIIRAILNVFEVEE